MESSKCDLHFLIKFADRHTIIERGRVAWSGSSAWIDADHSLWRRYPGA
jgi:branched-chain amino acid transport system ATP-binding protein